MICVAPVNGLALASAGNNLNPRPSDRGDTDMTLQTPQELANAIHTPTPKVWIFLVEFFLAMGLVGLALTPLTF